MEERTSPYGVESGSNVVAYRSALRELALRTLLPCTDAHDATRSALLSCAARERVTLNALLRERLLLRAGVPD